MGKLLALNEFLEKKADPIDKLTTLDILVYEDVQGSKIFVNYNQDQGFTIKAKSLRNEPLNVIDLAIQKLYYDAFKFFENLPDRIKSLMKPSQWFIFEYFPDQQPANIKYDSLPKNRLILTGIIEKNKKEQVDEEIIQEWAQVLNVDTLPIIFEGKLTEEQAKKIIDFYTTSPQDLEFIFGETNFAEYFFKILGSRKTKSYLMKDSFQDNMERIIIKFKDSKEKLTLAMFNPMYQKQAIDNKTQYLLTYSIIVTNFMEWFQIVDLSEVELASRSRSDAYIELMCKLFNAYYEEIGNNLDEIELHIPEFYQQDKFELNDMLIKNGITKSIIQKEKARYIFKLLLMSFQKKRKSTFGIFTDATLRFHNQIVDEIYTIIDNRLGIKSQSELQKKGYLTFQDIIKDEDWRRANQHVRTTD